MESIQTVKAALERRECPMREAMETALQDRTAAPAELTVTWEEVCRYLDSLVAGAAGGRRSRSTAPSWRRFTTFFRRTSGWLQTHWSSGAPPCCGKATRPVQPTPMCPPPMGCWPIWGGRDLQLIGQLDTEEEIQPELSRTEYLRLLATARNLGRERTYLMVKVFALTGIRVSELNRVMLRAVGGGTCSDRL